MLDPSSHLMGWTVWSITWRNYFASHIMSFRWKPCLLILDAAEGYNFHSWLQFFFSIFVYRKLVQKVGKFNCTLRNFWRATRQYLWYDLSLKLVFIQRRNPIINLEVGWLQLNSVRLFFREKNIDKNKRN